MKYAQGSWIELCNNDCGTLVYFDKERNLVCNASEESNDCVHKEVCDFLKDLRKGARAFNWYPSFAIDGALIKVFEARKHITTDIINLTNAVNELEETMRVQWQANKDAKEKWEKEKTAKLEYKKNSERAYEREQEQVAQWHRYEQTKKEETLRVPRFTTADRL